jgi:hypothetical protein
MNVKDVSKEVTKKNERPGREIRIDGTRFGNPNIIFKLGTAEDKNRPHTVYVNATFWVDIKNREDIVDGFDKAISKKYSRELKNIYKIDLKPTLENNNIFPLYYDNIYVSEFPENLNYNSKRSFTSIEISLHTLNCLNKEINLSLKDKVDNELFMEMMKISNIIANTDLLKGKLDFSIHKNK